MILDWNAAIRQYLEVELVARRTKAWINAAVLGITLVINWMGAVGIINGLSQREVSDMNPTLITPSPAAFSIWGVIYALLLVSVAVLIWKHDDTYYGQALDRISPLFWFSSALNVAWIAAFSYLQLGLSTLFIFAFVVTLAFILRELRSIHRGREWLLPLAFGLYGGWLFIATVVNVAAWLVSIEWQRFGLAENVWGTIILVVAVGLVIGVLLQHRNAVFPLPIAWAYFGIYRALVSPEGAGGQYGGMQAAALIGMAALVLTAAVQFVQNERSLYPVPRGRRA